MGVNGNVSPGILTAAHKNSDFVCLHVRGKTGNNARQICSKVLGEGYGEMCIDVSDHGSVHVVCQVIT